MIMLLIDERPEEVTDMARTVNAGYCLTSTNRRTSRENSRHCFEKAKRMVECGHDVVIFLDSITRLARACNTVSPAWGKSIVRRCGRQRTAQAETLLSGAAATLKAVVR